MHQYQKRPTAVQAAVTIPPPHAGSNAILGSRRRTAELSSPPRGCYKFRMAYNPLDWFRPSVAGAPAEPRKQFVAGLVVWVLAWLVVWWIQDQRAEFSSTLTTGQASAQKVFTEHSSDPKQTPAKVREVLGTQSSRQSIVSWVGTFVALGLFWGGGLLVFRALIGWGFFLAWLRRCKTVERLALVSAATLTISAVALHWIWNLVEAWMLAALVAALVLASAFGWKLPGKKQL